ncbi:MAG: ubiquinol-cytochrome c reductase iron-sulfur subunit [Candidatus Melainabacteria bacterium]
MPSDTKPCGSCGPCGNGGNITRRTFLRGVLAVFAAGWAAMMATPVFKYLNSSAAKSAGEEVASVSLGSPDAMAPGTGRNFQFGHKPALIIKGVDGQFHAYDAMCTHLGCTVQYTTPREGIWCACHGGKYDPETGTNIAGPPPKPLKRLEVAVVNDEVIVSRPGVKPQDAAAAAVKES